MRLASPLLLLLAASALADEKGAPPPDADRREEVLARVAGKAAAIQDLKADYEQASLREGRQKPSVSRGTLRYRVDPADGAALLLEVAEPERALIRLTRARMETYLPEDRQVEVVDLKEGEEGSRAVEATVLLYGRPRAFWEERFEVSVPPKEKPEDPDEIVLVPREKSLRKAVLEVHLWTDPATSLPLKTRYRYARGEEVTMTFGRVKANTGLKAKDLALSWPEGTEVLRPGAEGP